MPGAIRKLVFYYDTSNMLNVRLLVFLARPGYQNSTNGQYSTHTFTGITFQIDEGGYLDVFRVIENGHFTRCICVQDLDDLTSVEDRDPDPKCPRWGKQKLRKFLVAIWGIVDNLFDTPQDPFVMEGSALEFWLNEWNSSWNPPINTGGNGSGGSIFSYYFQDDIFYDNIFHLQLAECTDLFAHILLPLIN